MSGIGNAVSVGIDVEAEGSGPADGDDEPPHAASNRAVATTPVSARARRPVLRMHPR